MADFNDEVDYNSMTNKALITRGKGEAALYTGLMTARTETIKGYGSLLTEGSTIFPKICLSNHFCRVFNNFYFSLF